MFDSIAADKTRYDLENERSILAKTFEYVMLQINEEELNVEQQRKMSNETYESIKKND